MKLGKFLWGLLIVLFGVLLLGLNLDWWTADIWSLLADYWPVILILIGLRLFIRSDLIFSVIIILILILTGVSMKLNYSPSNNETIGTTTAGTLQEFSADATDITSANFSLDLGAARIKVSSLPTDSSHLFRGSFDARSTLKISDKIVDNIEKVSFKENTDFYIGKYGRRDFNLAVSPNFPLDFDINTGASELDLDFSSMILKKLSIDSGASSGKIKVGGLADEVEMNLSTGASSYTISVPKDIALRIVSDSALSSKNFDQLGLEKNGNVYQSSDYETSVKKFNFRVSAGVSNISIDRY